MQVIFDPSHRMDHDAVVASDADDVCPEARFDFGLDETAAALGAEDKMDQHRGIRMRHMAGDCTLPPLRGSIRFGTFTHRFRGGLRYNAAPPLCTYMPGCFHRRPPDALFSAYRRGLLSTAAPPLVLADSFASGV
jgi:hypothetical protein